MFWLLIILIVIGGLIESRLVSMLKVQREILADLRRQAK